MHRLYEGLVFFAPAAAWHISSVDCVFVANMSACDRFSWSSAGSRYSHKTGEGFQGHASSVRTRAIGGLHNVSTTWAPST